MCLARGRSAFDLPVRDLVFLRTRGDIWLTILCMRHWRAELEKSGPLDAARELQLRGALFGSIALTAIDDDYKLFHCRTRDAFLRSLRVYVIMKYLHDALKNVYASSLWLLAYAMCISSCP